DSAFLTRHAAAPAQATANCAICHARQSCARCHANAETVPAIAALEADARVAALLRAKPAEYPLPADHRRSDWVSRHGARARAEPRSCANCHVQPSCQACHTGSGASRAIAALPAPAPGGPAGVRITRAPGLVHPPGFATAHQAAAAAEPVECSACHRQSFCADCHAGQARPRFHLANFLARHGTESYARELDCGSCHSSETFCRACHASTGRAARGRLEAGFHNAQPLWLLQHGQAARQDLESCTTCHAQRDCTRCHSRKGGWGVNPHGPGFDAERMAGRNRVVCARCHLGEPPHTP
ncbi:MAG: hypothetical protein HY703_11385, partial [Gemmatimonadetes bacterium]|nr:hypothetical protein [Gemmatimonadota bacterium]